MCMNTTPRNLIYGLVDPRDGSVRYIGQTSTGLKRAAQHKWRVQSTETSHKANWVRKLHRLGLEYEIRILEEADSMESLDDLEIFWIAQMRGLVGSKLTNVSDGGGGVRGHVPTQEHRRKLSEALKGKKAFWFGKTLSEAAKHKISMAHRGRTLSEEHKRKIAIAGRGRKGPWALSDLTEADELKLSRMHGGRSIIDSLGRKYVSAAQASRQLKLCRSSIDKALHLGRTVGGGSGRPGAGLSFKYVPNENQVDNAVP